MKTYTKAKISFDTLFWFFGIEQGMIDCSIHTIDELEKAVDNKFTEEQIHLEIINNREEEILRQLSLLK